MLMNSDEGAASLWPDPPGRILICLIALLYCWDLPRVELSVTDEARSGMIIRNMVEGGHWLLPRTPDGYLGEKPPVYYGLCAVLGSLLGINEWTLRGVSVAMGAGTLVLVWILTRLYGSRRAAAVAVVALASNVLFMWTARQALVDMTLTFFLTAGLTAYLASRKGRLGPWPAAGLSGLALGLATLSKGPLGLALPMAVVGGDALFEHRGRFWRARRWWKQGLFALGVAVAVAGVWYLPGWIQGGREFLETCLLSENFRMPVGVAQGIGVPHTKTWYFYLGIQAAAVLAVAPLLPALVVWAGDRCRGRAQLAAWLFFGFALFQVAANKRTYYLMPLQPAVAAMIGLAADRAIASDRGRWLTVSSAVMGALTVMASFAVLAIVFRPGWLASLRGGSVSEAVRHQRSWILVMDLGLFGAGALLTTWATKGSEAALRGACLLALTAVAIRIGAGDRLESEFDRTRPFIAAMVPKLAPGELPVILPPVRGYSLDYYWPGHLRRDETTARSASAVLVARTHPVRFDGPREVLGVWSYGINGRDDILLLRKGGGR